MAVAHIDHDNNERLQFATAEPGLAPLVVAPAPGGLADLDNRSQKPAPLRGFRVDYAARATIAARVQSAVSMEWERGTAFLFAPIFMAVGALTYFNLPTEPGMWEIASGAGVLALLSFLTRRRLVAHLLMLTLLCVTLGIGFGKLETWRAGTKMLGGEISTRLTGRVAVIEHLANGRIRLTLDVVSTNRPKLRYAPERVRASARSLPSGIVAGSTIIGVVRLAPPSGPLRPNGYDFSFESYFDGIGANGFFLRGPDLIAAAGPPDTASRFWAWVENTRTALANRIEGHIGGAEGEIAAALVAGVRAGIPEDVNEALRKTGLAHVLSISGLHMALVAGTIMVMLRIGFALFPELASRRPVKKFAAGVALAAIAAYLFISGSAVAAERSFVMLAVMLAAIMVDRSALTMRNLAISAIVILAISPHEVAGPSFQMSFAATAALIGAYSAWSEHRKRQVVRATQPDRSLVRRAAGTGVRYFGGLAAASLLAGTATALFGAYHFQRVSTLGLAANLAAMPVVSVVVMPFAVLGMVMMPFGLDGLFFAIMGKGLTWMIVVTEWFAARSPIDAVGAIPVSSVFWLTAALVLATLLTTWLRLAALPLAAIGIALIATRPMPDILISEDARLVAVRTQNGLAINRTRPNGFTTENWLMAMNAGNLIKPTLAESLSPESKSASADAFSCTKEACVIRHMSGAMIAWAASADHARTYCNEAAFIVVDDATAKDVCATGTATVVTKRDLALSGGASVAISDNGLATITYAIGTASRPWHSHRQFSREARGMPPYQRKTAPAAAAPASDPT